MRRRLSIQVLRELDPRSRLRLAVTAGVVLLAVFTLATCGACGKRSPGGGETTPGHSSAAPDGGPVAKAGGDVDAAALRALPLWTSARDGDLEDLTTLAVHEGAAGLVEASSDPELRATAIRAMAYARGWAQLPFLAKTAAGKDDEEARLALASTVELAVRPRTAEDPEDAEELRVGCDGLLSLARDAARPRPRRIAAVRALRMMPCPPARQGEGLPTDVDAK